MEEAGEGKFEAPSHLLWAGGIHRASRSEENMFDTTQKAYTDFRDIAKERTTPIMAWIGSGLSVAAGGPTWLTLRERLIATLRDNRADSRSKLTNSIERQRPRRTRAIFGCRLRS